MRSPGWLYGDEMLLYILKKGVADRDLNSDKHRDILTGTETQEQQVTSFLSHIQDKE